MNRMRGLLVVTASLVAMSSVIWWTLGPVASGAATGNPQPWVVNHVTGDAFAPASDGSFPPSALSESQAVSAFERQDPDFNPPAQVAYQAGFFYPGHGQPDGPAGRAVWALTWHECPVSHDPNENGSIDRGVCTRWLFLDAYTGDMIVSEFQIPGSSTANPASSASCKPSAGAELRTLRLGVPAQTVTADVGDTIKVIAHVPGGRANTPQPFDHKHAVCRISVVRVSKGEVIAKFRARRSRKGKITFGASGVSSSKGCRPGSHGCPHPVPMIGYVTVKT